MMMDNDMMAKNVNRRLPRGSLDDGFPEHDASLRSEVMEITPEVAADWLGRPSANRPINSRKVRSYIGAIERGEWSLNGEAIKLDRHNRLVDGQHRCIAIVQSGKSIQSLVVFGVEPETFDSMDSGLLRSAANVLAIHDIPNAVEVAAAVRLVLRYDWYGDFFNHPERQDPSKQQVLAAAREWSGMRESILRCKAKYIHQLRFSPATLAALHFIFSNLDQDDASTFFDRLASGAALGPHDPVHVLRERLITASLAKQRLSITEGAALVIKAWNAYREGRSITMLAWRPGGARPESFPAIR